MQCIPEDTANGLNPEQYISDFGCNNQQANHMAVLFNEQVTAKKIGKKFWFRIKKSLKTIYREESEKNKEPPVVEGKSFQLLKTDYDQLKIDHDNQTEKFDEMKQDNEQLGKKVFQLDTTITHLKEQYLKMESSKHIESPPQVITSKSDFNAEEIKQNAKMELNDNYIEIINDFLEEVGEIQIKKLNKRSLKEVLDNIIEAKGEYNYKIQDIQREYVEIDLKLKDAQAKIQEMEGTIAKKQKSIVKLKKKKTDLKNSIDDLNNKKLEADYIVETEENLNEDDAAYKKRLELQGKQDHMRTTLDSKMSDHEKLKIENEDLKFKLEDALTQTEIATKNIDIQKLKFQALNEDLNKKVNEVTDIQKKVTDSNSQMTIKEDQILSHIKGQLQNFFKCVMNKTTKTSKIDTQEFQDLLLNTVRLNHEEKEETLELLRKGKFKDSIKKKLK